LVDGGVGSVAGVFNGLRDVLNVVPDLLLLGGGGYWARADQVHKRLDTLNEESGLVFEIVLRSVRGISVSSEMRTYLELGHAVINRIGHAIHSSTLAVIAAVR
jgi:predicted NBD/HSP70 family sugar kinase